MKYIVRKVVTAKNLKAAMRKERDTPPLEIYMQEDEFKKHSLTEENIKKVGFK